MGIKETVGSIFLIVSALFPIVNPLGGSPIFLALTKDYSKSDRKNVSWRIAVNSFFLLVGSYLIGTYILSFFGISLPVVQVGGGLVVISSGWALLERRDDDERQEVHRNVTECDPFRQAFYPLTLPLTVGPGSISVAITLGANVAHTSTFHVVAIVTAIAGSAIIALSIFVCYGFADRFARLLGVNGMNVLMRLSSFLLVCIGVQILWNGVRTLLATVPWRGH